MRAVAGLLLAAGASERMGRPKQLLVHAGESLVRRAARRLTESHCVRCAAVVGAHRQRVEAELAGLPIELVENANWSEGMASSLRVGVEWAMRGSSTVEGVLVTLVDQPRVTRTHLDALLARFDAGEDLTATGYSDRKGVPAVLARNHFEALCSLRGDQGARALLRGASGRVAEIGLEGAEQDIDTPDDYARLISESTEED